MQSLKDFLGCQCRAHRGNRRQSSDSNAYTFSWAQTQYSEDRPVLPFHESLELSLNIDKEELSGVATIDFKVVQKEVQKVKINACELKIHDVQFTLRGQFNPVQFEIEPQYVVVHLPNKMLRGDQGQIKIVYTAHKPRAGIYFIKPDEAYPDRPTQVWTQGQDDDARYWFPCFDEPGIKFAFDLKIEVPAGYIATSNGALHSEVRGGKVWSFHWKTQFLLPAYLVTLTVGKFSEIKDDWRGKAVTYLVEKGREAEAKVSFGKTPKMLEFFSQKIGVDYPYEKYAQIAVSEFVFGGMENTSATTQTDATLHPLEIEEDFTSDDLVAHELAHQWFGDLVTCKHWSHGWLNEGWATFMEYVFKEQDMGKDEADYYRYEDLNVYFDEDAEFRRPIVTNYYADPAEVWDRHTYQKAGLVLQTLKAHVGDTDFWAATKKYLDTHKGGVVETVDFQRAFEAVSGESLQKFFDQWVYKAGFPDLKISYQWDEKKNLAQIKVEQKQKPENNVSIFELKTAVEFVYKDKSKEVMNLNITQAEQTFYFSLKEKPQYFIFDRGNHLLKKLEWAIPQDMIKAQLENDDDVVGKIWALKNLAKEPSLDAVEIMESSLKKDPFWGVRAEAALALAKTKTQTAERALLSALSEEKKAKVRAKICKALGSFKSQKAADALIERIDSDKNIFVKGAACSALGKTKNQKAFDKLKSATQIKSWRDYVTAQAYAGLANLYDEKAHNLFVQGARYGAPKYARANAILGLGHVAWEKPEVRELLVETLDDPYLGAKRAAIEALVARKENHAVSALEGVAHRVIDGHFKAQAFRAAHQIRAEQNKPSELKELNERIEKLSEQNLKLIERLDRLDKTKELT
ncbi:MAG: HEAT repeat domain-containing protein [Oligoflexia bacterium]|nr:HEAT repeat domain-containing protein [Oligoflexia bacterium]